MQIRFFDFRGRIGSALMRGYVLNIGSPASAQSADTIDRFVGSWREDESKAQLGSGGMVIFQRTSVGGELQILWPNGAIQNLTLTGQPVPAVGPIAGTMLASRLMPDGSIDVTQSRNGKPLARIVYSVSADGGTMSQTTTRLDDGGRKPSVYVFMKQ